MRALEVKDLTKKYPGVAAVNALSFSVAAGRIFGFVGPDGAGKTTLFRMLCGILVPTEGSIFALGVDVVRNPEKLKRELGYMPQKFALYQDLTVRENLDFFADLYETPLEGLEQRKLELLRFAGLLQFQRRPAGNLSGGMKQKLALCCTLIHAPRLLILDEPTTGVDPVSRKEFWDLLMPLPERGTTVIASTAYMDEAEKCHDVALMNLGKIMKIGSPSSLKENLQGRIYEVRDERIREVQRYLAEQAWLEEIQVFGDRLHAQVRTGLAGEPGLERLRDLLQTAGFPGARAALIRPSLEDVFVSLMDR
ncbi:MAG: ATP-binding cassette domain-containing protein [Bacillota bacterium]